MIQQREGRTAIAVTVAVMQLAAAAMLWAPQTASAQVVTACTTSMISSFTPCLNYLTGSSNAGSSPTADCCGALGGLLSSSTECSCLILTGNVPFSLPINRTLAIALPRVCRSKSVPLFQCKDSATPRPPPAPAGFGPGLPPLPPFSTPPSVVSPPAPPPPAKMMPPAPAKSPSVSVDPGTQGLRPLVLPSSAVTPPSAYSVHLLLPLPIGAALLNRFF